MRTLLRTGLLALATTLLLPQCGQAQTRYGLYEEPAQLGTFEQGWTPRSRFLLRPNTALDYNNVGWTRYRERGSGFDWLSTYDQLGERWLAGSASMFSWTEDRTQAPSYSSSFRRSGNLQGRHNGIIVAKEEFSAGALRFMMGSSLRSTFTSLTFDKARFNGIRADAIIGQNHELTILSTRASDPRFRIRLVDIGDEVVDQGTLLTGGHWQGRFLQGAIDFGATLVNHHRFDSLQEDGNYWRGTTPRQMNPDSVIVRISDDGRGTTGGATVYGGSARLTLRNEANVNRIVAGVQPVVFVTDGVTRQDGHWLVQGSDYLEQVVPVPNSAVGVYTTSAVADDYQLGMRQVHRATDIVSVTERIRRSALLIRQRAEGDGQGTARDVSFDHGLSTALNVMGLNGKVSLGKAVIDWEFARSLAYFQFPEEQIGTRSHYAGNAFFARGSQGWRNVTFGGELFSISPRYQSYALDDRNFRRGDHVAFGNADVVDRDFNGNNFDFYFNEIQPNVYNTGNEKRSMSFGFVDDNDDDDQFLDQGQNDQPFRIRTQPNESGVYPGWDLDQDGTPDYNRNRNSIPDFAEPFFKYEQEEQTFYWGDDFNHNGVLDYFEDDSLPDYPYYKDERGNHVFVDLELPIKGLGLRLGRVRVEQIAGSGKSDADYVALSYRRIFPGLARLQWEHEFKLVEDGIANHTFTYILDENVSDVDGLYSSVFVEDRMHMRDSNLNRGYIGTYLQPVRGLNLKNNLRYEINSKNAGNFGGGLSQKSETLTTWALVNKIDYTWQWHGVSVQSRLKHLYLRQDEQMGTGPGGLPSKRDVTELVPILMGGFRLTDLTSLELGIEGFPFLKERFVDRDNEILDFDSETYLAQLKMKGLSGGFNVFLVTGIQYTRKEFDDKSLESGGFVRTFFQIYVGEQILAAAQ
ncbi:MAG: hypothetical protein VCF24_13080 [Candidatus Latescibacterota bacterium]